MEFTSEGLPKVTEQTTTKLLDTYTIYLQKGAMKSYVRRRLYRIFEENPHFMVFAISITNVREFYTRVAIVGFYELIANEMGRRSPCISHDTALGLERDISRAFVEERREAFSRALLQRVNEDNPYIRKFEIDLAQVVSETTATRIDLHLVDELTSILYALAQRQGESARLAQAFQE